MPLIQVQTDPRVAEIFAQYPDEVRLKMQGLRALILEVAEEVEGLDVLEETLKWGEPSYLAKKGSTLRIDWKARTPSTYQMYFKCTSRLIETFRTLFEHELNFQGNRAIVFRIDEPLPTETLKPCIRAALNYHQVKTLPTLGI